MEPDDLNRWQLRLDLPVPIRWVAQTGSTNADLADLARRGAPHGAALLADRQTAGKGRMGRTWEAPAGSAVLLSVLLRPELLPRQVPLICLAAAVATADVCGPGFLIKWPNDVLSGDGRKVAGILAEMEVVGGRVSHVVVGIGVNVTAAPNLPTATCLAEHGGRLDRAELASRLVAGVLDEVAALQVRPQAVLDRWRARSATLGRRVDVAGVAGEAVDLGDDGALLVRRDDGTVHRVLAGDVRMVG